MLLYPSDLLHAFELDKIAERLAGHCRSVMGSEHAKDLPILTDERQINQRLDEAAEFLTLLRSDSPLPQDEYPDVRAEVAALDQDEAVLDEEACNRLRRMARAYEGIHRFLLKHREDFPALTEIVATLPPEKEVIQSIDRILDEEGKIRPNASPELVRIRKDTETRRREQQRAFRSVISRLRQAGVLAETEESIRGGRQVIALKAEHKRKISGIVHDESDSGRTTFVEPEETVFLNNEIASLEREERREIRRILRDLTSTLAPHQDGLAENLIRLGWIDFCRAKGLLAWELDAERPRVTKGSRVVLSHARHPLLLLLHKKNKKPTVPLDLELDQNSRILVVSGPNAGGKSVCLKTTGLLQLMVQAGLLVPVDARRSHFGIFRQIFGDIGDTQSLEDELSTYSARLYRMRYFLEHAAADSLILIDEFGSGTDPGLGGAIAEAILDALRRSGTFGVVTTHYANLKIYSGRTPGLENGAMVFDEVNLEPQYRLETGKPGSSYTFDIARKIALPAPVIRHAESLVKTENLQFEGLLSQLQNEQQELARRKTEFNAKEREVQQRLDDYEAATKRLNEEQQLLRLGRKEKQLDALAQYEAQFGAILQQLKDAQNKQTLQPELIHKASRKATAEGEILRAEVRKIKKALRYQDVEGEIEEGSAVRLLEGKETGRVMSLRKNKALVSFGQLRTTVKLDELVLVEEKQLTSSGPRKAPIRPETPTGAFSRELDIRGKTRDEAIEEVDQYLNDSVMRSVSSVRIIHGKGGGVLRDAVKQTARNYKMIRQLRHEDPKLGGDGVTIIEFE